MVHYPSLKELKKTLGDDYKIRIIDWEKCLYRDFGNGFNIEVSGCSRSNRKGTATVYLWFGEHAHSCFILKIMRDVGRSAKGYMMQSMTCESSQKHLLATAIHIGTSCGILNKFITKERNYNETQILLRRGAYIYQ